MTIFKARRALFHWLRVGAALVLTLGLAPAVTLPATPVAWAAGFSVNSLSDPGDGTCDGSCTLRDAILAANLASGGDTITFSTGGTIVLGATLPTITGPLTIDGSGQTVAIDGANAFRVLTATAPLTLTALTVQHGRTFGGVASGAGAYFGSGATLTGATFWANAAGGFGGGAYFVGSVKVSGGSFVSNTAAASGGGAYMAGPAIVTGASFISNTATPPAVGGGAYFASSVTLTAASFISNTAARGGGAEFYGTTVVVGSTFRNNQTLEFGGGAEFPGLDATVIAASFISNTSLFVGGGAVFLHTATVTGSTFKHNQAPRGGAAYFLNSNSTWTSNLVWANTGGGLYVDDGANVILDNNIIAANQPLSNTATGDVTVSGFFGVLSGRHNTFAAATPPTGIAAIRAGWLVSLTNTIFSGYGVGVQVQTNVTSSVTLDGVLWSGVTTPTQGAVFTVTNAYTGSAAFVNAAAGDYHLTAGSAARDVGVATTLLVDIDGQTRPNGLGPDLGADEYLLLAYQLMLPLITR